MHTRAFIFTLLVFYSLRLRVRPTAASNQKFYVYQHKKKRKKHLSWALCVPSATPPHKYGRDSPGDGLHKASARQYG